MTNSTKEKYDDFLFLLLPSAGEATASERHENFGKCFAPDALPEANWVQTHSLGITRPQAESAGQ